MTHSAVIMSSGNDEQANSSARSESSESSNGTSMWRVTGSNQQDKRIPAQFRTITTVSPASTISPSPVYRRSSSISNISASSVAPAAWRWPSTTS